MGRRGPRTGSALGRGSSALAPARPTPRAGPVTFAAGGANTRTAQLFVNLRDNARLDATSFAPVGEVVRGMEVVDQLHTGYGEGAPAGQGPTQQRIGAEGEPYLAKDFPLLDRIIRAVEDAQATRAPTQRLVDRFAAVYTPAVFAIAVLVAVGAPLLLGWAWLDAIYRALVLLVIACPCALVLSTPVTVPSGLAAAAPRGILIKSGARLGHARGIPPLGF